jgi:hypothetical protein
LWSRLAGVADTALHLDDSSDAIASKPAPTVRAILWVGFDGDKLGFL